MPRSTALRKSLGIGGQTIHAAPGLSVQAPLNVQADINNRASGVAQALGLGVDIGETLLEKQTDKDIAQAEADSLRGVVGADRLRTSIAYETTIQKEDLQRDLENTTLQISSELEEKIASGEFKSPTEVNEFIDENFREFLQDDDGTLTDRYGPTSNFGEAVKTMDVFRSRTIASAFDMIEKVQDRKMFSSKAVRLDNFHTFNGSFNLAQLLQEVPRSKRIPLRNELVRKAMNIAIQQGDPEALTAMLKSKYGDGTPVLDAQSETQVQNAILTATNKSVRLQEEGLKQAERVTNLQLTTDAIKGKDITNDVIEQADLGNISGALARTLFAFNQQYKDNVQEGELNTDFAALFEQSIWLKDLSSDELTQQVTEAATTGQLGTGKASLREMSRLLKLIKDVKDDDQAEDSRDSRDAFTRERGVLKGSFLIQKTEGSVLIGGGIPNPKQTQALALALSFMHRELLKLPDAKDNEQGVLDIRNKAVELYLKDWDKMANAFPVNIPKAEPKTPQEELAFQDAKIAEIEAALEATR